MNDLKELFVACGGEISGSDTTDFVSIPREMIPINIVLKVIPTGIDLRSGVVALHVLLSDKLEATEHGQILQYTYDIDLNLPIEAIELANGAT